MRERSEKTLQVGLVVFRHLFERNAHSEVRIINDNSPLGFDADSVSLKLHMQVGSCGIRGLGLHVTSVHADIGEADPRLDVYTFFAELGAALAFVTEAAALFRALELVIGMGCGRLIGNL